MSLLWQLTLQTKLNRNPYYTNSGEFFQQAEPYIKERTSVYIRLATSCTSHYNIKKLGSFRLATKD